MSDLYSIYLQPGIREYINDLTNSLTLEQEKHKAYIRNVYHLYGYGLWGVFLKDSGKLIGRCGIELKKLDNEQIYELGYLLSNEYQGMGYARKFVNEIIQYCFHELDIPRIVAVIDSRNLRSLHLAENVGMTKYSECMMNGHLYFKYEITPH
jgi:RimJ/RimL family protein N-acetyltransferase